MAGSVNKVILVGRVGQDPEVKTIPSGSKVANFSMATSEKYTDKDGQKVENTEWHRLVAWRGLAEILEKYVHKGDLLYIEGKLQTRKWEDQNGNTRYTTEILVNQMQMLSSKRQESSQPPPQQQQQQNTGPDGMPPAPEDDLPF